MNEPSEIQSKAEQLARLADMLRLEIAPADLESLSNQLLLIEALEEAELQDHPPILKLDADWHD